MTLRNWLIATVAATITAVASTAGAAAMPYNETADAKAEVQQALTDAKTSHLPVLLIFGANWCGDCRALDAALKSEKNADLIAHSFKVVKIDVGNFDHNLDVAQSYGNPIEKGIPAAVVVSPNNEVLYATRAGELANARHMSETGIYDFFKHVTDEAQAKH